MTKPVPLSRQALEVSHALGEPEWLARKRLEAVELLEKKNGSAEVSGFRMEKGKLSVESECSGNAAVLPIGEALERGNALREQVGRPFSGREPDAYLLSFALFTEATVVAVDSGKPARITLELSGKAPEYSAVFFLFADKSESSVFLRKRIENSASQCLSLAIGTDAAVHFCTLQQNGGKADTEYGMVARLGENSRLKFLSSGLGGREQHEQELFLQDGRGSRCEHYEVSIAKGSQKLRKDSDHIHLAPDTYSRVVFKYATTGSSRVEVNGNVTIEQSAPGSDTHLLARSLLMSEKSVSHIIPQLFVRNSEVMAGHGSSMTPLSEEELFYLRSRGIGESESRLLVLQGFLQDLLAKSEIEPALLETLGAELEKDALALFPRD